MIHIFSFLISTWTVGKSSKNYSDAGKILLTFAVNISILKTNTTTKFSGQFFEFQKMHAMELENGTSYAEEKSNLKCRKKYLIINLRLRALLFGSVSFNKEYLRLSFRNVPFVRTLLGCFPNFIAAYVVSLFPIGGALARKLNRGRAIIYSSAVLVFILLTAEELMPFFKASKVFDFYDIVASGVGALLAVLTYELIVFFKRKNEAGC